MPSLTADRSRAIVAVDVVATLFESNGWIVEVPQSEAQPSADLIVRKGGRQFAVEIKSLAEGRPDRVIPLLAQALLQAKAYATLLGAAEPMAVIYVQAASLSLIKQIESFFDRYAPETALGIVTSRGWRYFRGNGLHELTSQDKLDSRSWTGATAANAPVNLFSDLNQWLLKVMLAPDLPEHMLRAPRGNYRSGVDLASAADVSTMSVSRFVQQLKLEGFLAEHSQRLVLVRRAELLRRWQAAVVRQPAELPMRFLIKAPVQMQLHTLLRAQQYGSCLGLFAAADALGMGHVSGVPPYMLVDKLPHAGDQQWRGVAASQADKPDFVVRQALSPKSTFRGSVQIDGVYASDVIQTWLDVAHHPARGKEQAEFIYRKYLQPLTQTQ